MGLLDLPIELLRPIIREDVRGPDSCSYQKLGLGCPPWANTDVISPARVNRKFYPPRDEFLLTRHAVLESEVFGILEEAKCLTTNASRPSSAFDLHPEYPAFIAKYVLLRPYDDVARWNDHFPALVDGVVDAIIQLRRQSAPRRAHMVTTLCRKAALHLLISKKLPVIAELLGQNSDLTRTHSDFVGSPVQAAIQANDSNLVCRFLLHGAAFEYPGWLKDIVRAPDAARLLAVLAVNQRVQAVLRTSICDVTEAIACSVERGKEDVAITLLQTQEDAFGHGSMGYYLRKAVLEACTRGMPELLLLLIEAGGFVQTSAWTGPNLRHLLNAGVSHVGLEGVLVEATKTGTVGVLRVLLDHGVRLSPVQAMNLLASIAPWSSTDTGVSTSSILQRTVFLHEHIAVDLEALLAVEAYTGFGAAHLMMVAAQRGNFTLLAALARFGVPLDDVGFYARAGCAVPVIAAEAYGWGETAAKLRALAIERERESKKAVVPIPRKM
ncbi:hypothetical protein P171DRAFT_522881 [Karstenula rhodostoma CBS 690.94]|uniref:Ankyrin n=1 Tax=Karstenula rhodostoma CBS 690.94 TaxID=1392251 RepID=A0A9P4PDY1_9PLEO|nr:hypothetical protein P171DRAFT_522881 [Karstenula rhodostoma CBS 690.94]